MRQVKAALALVVAGGVAWSLSACVPSTSGPEHAEPDDWVVVRFEDNHDYMAMDAVDGLLETELAADEALQRAEAGWIDGNDVGDNVYELYFVGWGRERMWGVLEPVFAGAPLPWTQVELRDGLDDPTPTVLPRRESSG